MANVEIKKAKLKSDMFLEVEYSEVVEDGTNNVKKECTAAVHDDLKKLFRRLPAHLAMLCEQVKELHDGTGVAVNFDSERPNLLLCDPELLYRFSERDWNIIDNTTCTGFSIGGSGDSEGVTIYGRRELGNGKVINLVAPFQKWDNDSFNYGNTSDLSEIIEAARYEVHQYLFEGKHAPDMQLSLFDEGDGNDDATSETDEATALPKKGRGRKKKEETVPDEF